MEIFLSVMEAEPNLKSLLRRRFFKRFAGNRGVTMIEMMFALTISIIGFVGVLDLQTASIQGATESRALYHAIQLSEHFIETMRTEAIEWTATKSLDSDANSFYLLKDAPPKTAAVGTTSGWLIWREAFASTLGNMDHYDSGVLQEFPITQNSDFCVHYRFTTLMQDMLIRADVRIIWPKAGAQRSIYDTCPLQMATDTSRASSITIPVVLMRNLFVQ